MASCALRAAFFFGRGIAGLSYQSPGKNQRERFYYRNDRAPIHWESNSNIVWNVELPGPGNSSPIVSCGRVFITCAEDNGRLRNLYCFDRRNGERLWVRTVEFDGDEPTHRANPYCGSTPVADGSRVVVWHGSAGVHGHDYNGEKLWRAVVHRQRGTRHGPVNRLPERGGVTVAGTCRVRCPSANRGRTRLHIMLRTGDETKSLSRGWPEAVWDDWLD